LIGHGYGGSGDIGACIDVDTGIGIVTGQVCSKIFVTGPGHEQLNTRSIGSERRSIILIDSCSQPKRNLFQTVTLLHRIRVKFTLQAQRPFVIPSNLIRQAKASRAPIFSHDTAQNRGTIELDIQVKPVIALDHQTIVCCRSHIAGTCIPADGIVVDDPGQLLDHITQDISGLDGVGNIVQCDDPGIVFQVFKVVHAYQCLGGAHIHLHINILTLVGIDIKSLISVVRPGFRRCNIDDHVSIRLACQYHLVGIF